MKRIRI
jgi:hypothetical protein